MCKINGHSIFSYMYQPAWNWKKLATSKERDRKVQEAQARAAEIKKNNSTGEEVSKTATTAQVNDNKNKQTISSLRVPLENNVGASVGGTKALGLNIGG